MSYQRVISFKTLRLPAKAIKIAKKKYKKSHHGIAHVLARYWGGERKLKSNKNLKKEYVSKYFYFKLKSPV